MENRINVLIVGANFSNKGAEAMLMTVQQELYARNKNVTFYMLCRQYEKELAELNNFVPIFDETPPFFKTIKSFAKRVEGKLFKTFTGKNKPFVFPFPFKTIEKKVKQLDMVIDISGFAYADSWGKPMIEETIKLQNFCKRKFNAKFYFLPQAWGSFNKPEVAEAAKRMLLNADKFYARDLVSQDYLYKLLKTENIEVPLLTDIAFSYKGNNKVNGLELIKSLGYNEGKRPLIGISPNLRVYEKVEGKGKENGYVQILLRLSDYCLNILGVDIILIPNEIFPDGCNALDDRHLCRILNEMINREDRCFFLDRYCSANEIKSLVSQVDYLVSSRFHALIFGFLYATPVMAISWSHKYKELFSIFGMENFVLEWDAMDPENAIKQLNQLIGNKEGVKASISSKLDELNQKTSHMFDEMAPVPLKLEGEVLQ